MVDINHNAEWFQTAAGVTEFEKITTLEERTIFIQAFLEKTTDELKENKLLEYEREDAKKNNFRFALFLADAIYGSSLPYSKYPALIDVNQNPFMKKWKDNKYGLHIKLSTMKYILCEESKKLFGGNAKSSFKESLIREHSKLGSEQFGKTAFIYLPDTSIFDIDPSLQSAQLKFICLLGD